MGSAFRCALLLLAFAGDVFAAEKALEPYHATPEDFSAIQDGIEGALKIAPEIFPNGIEKIDVVLYDSTNLYIWTQSSYPLTEIGTWNGYKIYRASHGATPSEREMGRCGGTPSFILTTLVKNREGFSFSCSPMGAQTAIQKKRGSIYDTRESYLATIVHEYGHQYMYQELWQILAVSRLAKIVKKLTKDTSNTNVLEESYAIWCELIAGRKFYPSHYQRLRSDFPRPGSREPHHLGFQAALELLEQPQ